MVVSQSPLQCGTHVLPRSVDLSTPDEAPLLRPGVPRYAVRMVRPWLVRVPRTYSTWGPGGKPPCASGTYPTREAGTRSPYVPNGGPGEYVSAQVVATSVDQIRVREGADSVRNRARVALPLRVVADVLRAELLPGGADGEQGEQGELTACDRLPTQHSSCSAARRVEATFAKAKR